MRILFVCLYSFLVSCILEARTYIVCVGISDYKEINDLRLPENDAKTIKAVYTASGADAILLLGRNATKSNILAQARKQFAKATSQDEIVLFFSGHGYQGGICPYDMSKTIGGGITYKELQTLLRTSSAKQKIIIADACYSGGLRNEKSKQSSDSENHDDKNVILFLSSRGGEPSAESPWMKNGYFTTYLARGLKGGADTNQDRKISAKEIFTFVSNGVKGKSEDKQHPVMWGSFDDNFVLINWN